MDDQPPDVIALTPDYPMSHLDTPSDSSQPHAQDPFLPNLMLRIPFLSARNVIDSLTRPGY